MKRIASLLAIFALGLAIGYFGKVLIDRNPSEKYGIQIDGMEISGRLSDFQKMDIEGITAAMKLIDPKYPIMSIQFVSPSEVEITTGVVRGPLNGSGRYYKLKKQGETWVQIETDHIRHWVS